MRIALTDMAIRKLTPPEKGQLKVWDTNLPGFGLLVGKRTKTFLVVYGKDRRNLTIGRYPEVSLREAREAAKGVLVAKPQKRRSKSLTELSTAFLDDCRTRLRPSSVRRYEVVLKHAPDIPIDEVSKSLAKTAHEVMAYKVMFNWACRMELAERNPFQYSKTTINHRDRVLSDDEIAAIWHYEDGIFSDVVKLLLLTGQRRNQIVSIEPSWIDDDTINFPASIMKSKRPHTIPFGQLTTQYLKPLRFNGWGKSKARMDKAIGVNDWVLHDLRRYYSTTMAKLGVPLHITEHLLDHRTSTSGVQAVYMRYGFLPEMREAVSQFESHIASIIAA